MRYPINNRIPINGWLNLAWIHRYIMIYPIVTIPLVRILSRGDRLQRALYGAALPALQQPTCSQVEGYPRGTARWEDWAIWAVHPSIHPPTTPINKTYLSLHLTKKGTNGNGTYTSTHTHTCADWCINKKRAASINGCNMVSFLYPDMYLVTFFGQCWDGILEEGFGCGTMKVLQLRPTHLGHFLFSTIQLAILSHLLCPHDC